MLTLWMLLVVFLVLAFRCARARRRGLARARARARVCVCVCGFAGQAQPAALRSGRKRRAGSTPLRHAYIGAGKLPGHLASQSKVSRASYLPAGRGPSKAPNDPGYFPSKLEFPRAVSLAITKPTM